MVAQFVAGRRGRRSSTAQPYKIIKLKSANHRELSMRNDQAPFTDARVRQAVALHARPPGHGQRSAARLRQRSATTARSRRGSRRPTLSVPQRDAGHRQGQAAAGGGRPPERVHRRTLYTEIYAGDPAAAPQVIKAERRPGRDQHQPQDRDPDRLLRQGDVRQLRLARRRR